MEKYYEINHVKFGNKPTKELRYWTIGKKGNRIRARWHEWTIPRIDKWVAEHPEYKELEWSANKWEMEESRKARLAELEAQNDKDDANAWNKQKALEKDIRAWRQNRYSVQNNGLGSGKGIFHGTLRTGL